MKRSVPLTIGLVVAGLLGLLDAVPFYAGDEAGPSLPAAVIALGVLLGVATLGGVALAWFKRSRAGVVTVIVARLLSALAAVPAFFAADAPAVAKTMVAVTTTVTLLCVALIAPALRTSTAATA